MLLFHSLFFQILRSFFFLCALCMHHSCGGTSSGLSRMRLPEAAARRRNAAILASSLRWYSLRRSVRAASRASARARWRAASRAAAAASSASASRRSMPPVKSASSSSRARRAALAFARRAPSAARPVSRGATSSRMSSMSSFSSRHRRFPALLNDPTPSSSSLGLGCC